MYRRLTENLTNYVDNYRLDRLLHHAHIVPIAGDSYRLKHQRHAGMVPLDLPRTPD